MMMIMIMIMIIMIMIMIVTDIPAVWTRLSGNLNMIIVIIFMIMIMIMIMIYNKNLTFTMTMINMVKMRKPRCFQTLASPDNFPPHQGLACLRSPGNDDYHRHHDDYVVGGDDRDCRHIDCIIGVEVWLIGKNTGTVSDEQ